MGRALLLIFLTTSIWGAWRDDNLGKRIAHATGSIDGNVYTNSKDALKRTIHKGCKFIEIDFYTTDGASAPKRLVGYHGKHNREKVYYPSFMNSKIMGKYEPLNQFRVAGLLFTENKTWYLIPDVKQSFKWSTKQLCQAIRWWGVDCRERMYPFVYNKANVRLARKWKFPRVIFANYWNNYSANYVYRLARRNKHIVAVAFPKDRTWSRYWIRRFHRIGVKTYVHTINGEKELQRYYGYGFYGIITDDNCLAPRAKPAK